MMRTNIILPSRLQYPSPTEVRMGIKNGLRRTADGWQAIARVRVAGKIVQKKKTITGTKEEAKALREALKKQLRGLPACSLTSPIKTFKDIIGKYREKRGEPFSEKHEYNVARLENEFGPVDARSFPMALERLIARYRKEEKYHQANRFIEIARAAYNCCVGLELIKKNPITPELFPETKEEPHDVSLPLEEQKRIVLIAAKNRRTAHIARYLQYVYQVPSRKLEIVGVAIRDIDLFNMAIRIRNGTTKNDAGIWKPVPPSMQKWVRRRAARARSLDEPLFARYVKCTDTMALLGDFKNAWNTVRTKAGYPKLTIHDSRHISATELRDNGTPDHILNEVAGWKTNMLETYYHRSPKRLLELVRFSRPGREPAVNPKQAEVI